MNTKKTYTFQKKKTLEIFNVKTLINLLKKVGMFQYPREAIGANCRFTAPGQSWRMQY